MEPVTWPISDCSTCLNDGHQSCKYDIGEHQVRTIRERVGALDQELTQPKQSTIKSRLTRSARASFSLMTHQKLQVRTPQDAPLSTVIHLCWTGRRRISSAICTTTVGEAGNPVIARRVVHQTGFFSAFGNSCSVFMRS